VTPPQIGSVAGTVRANEEYELPGATVTLIPKDCKCESAAAACCLRSRVTITDVRGEYSFLGVAPGPYEVMSDLIGLNAARKTVVVKSAASAEAHVSMKWAPDESITLTAGSPLVEIEGVESGRPVVFQRVGCKCSTKCPSDPICSCCPAGIAIFTDEEEQPKRRFPPANIA
jgi:Carboxypeptidase regulatory-like domain